MKSVYDCTPSVALNDLSCSTGTGFACLIGGGAGVGGLHAYGVACLACQHRLDCIDFDSTEKCSLAKDAASRTKFHHILEDDAGSSSWGVWAGGFRGGTATSGEPGGFREKDLQRSSVRLAEQVPGCYAHAGHAPTACTAHPCPVEPLSSLHSSTSGHFPTGHQSPEQLFRGQTCCTTAEMDQAWRRSHSPITIHAKNECIKLTVLGEGSCSPLWPGCVSKLVV